MRELQDFHGPAEDEPWHRTLVAEVNQQLVAVGTVRLGQRHPARYWLSLNVPPGWRERGIGSHLLADLRSLTAHDPLTPRATSYIWCSLAFLAWTSRKRRALRQGSLRSALDMRPARGR